MLYKTLSEFWLKIESKILLSLDVSKKRIGIAVSNSDLTLALPVKVIQRTNQIKDIEHIKEIYFSYNCGGLVIGYPIYNGSDKTPRCQAIRSFTRTLNCYLNVPMFFENEEYSTFAAKDLSLKKGGKHYLDDHAAAFFLQNLLNRKPNS